MSEKADIPAIRDKIFSANDRRVEEVRVPEWDVTLWVRGLTGTERDALEDSMMQKRGQIDIANFRARLLVKTVVDNEGQRIFSDADATALGDKSAAAIERLVNVAMRLSGIRAGDVEQLVKNSEPGPSDASISG